MNIEGRKIEPRAIYTGGMFASYNSMLPAYLSHIKLSWRRRLCLSSSVIESLSLVHVVFGWTNILLVSLYF